MQDIPEKRASGCMNCIEYKLFEALKENGVDSEPQYEISEMHVDFAFPDKWLVIEVNGPYHATDGGRERDNKRKHVLERMGWYVREYDAEFVDNDPNWVALEIKSLLAKYDGSPNPRHEHSCPLYLDGSIQTKKSEDTLKDLVEEELEKEADKDIQQQLKEEKEGDWEFDG